MTFNEFKTKWVGKRYQESSNYWYQCVALAKLFVSETTDHNLKWFSWSALKARQTWSPFVWLRYQRIPYTWIGSPRRWDIVFFNKTKQNKYWHVAIAWTCTEKELRVIEQNAVSWNWLGINWDEISIRMYPYKWWKTWDVLWWYTLK